VQIYSSFKYWGCIGFDSIVDANDSRKTATVKIVAKDNWQYESNSNVSRISDSYLRIPSLFPYLRTEGST
jgi:hypothetical protein